MALFPRRIGGSYAMLSRRDQENITRRVLRRRCTSGTPASDARARRRPWELVQLGNCGSPIETEAGWLVLTHGVGPMRTYGIGALLLDLDDPTRVGSLATPLITPEEERDGYVPNVVYSCGGFTATGSSCRTDLAIRPSPS